MSRLPNGTHEYTDEFGVKHYTENVHRMWDLAIMLYREDVENCQPLSKSDYDSIAFACHRVGMTYWTADKIDDYYANLIGRTSRSERLASNISLQRHVNNHRSLCGLTEVQF